MSDIDRLAYARAGIEAAVEAMSRAFASDGLHRLGDFYTDDAMIISYRYNKFRHVVTGLDNIKATWHSIPGPIFWQLTISQLIDTSDSFCHIGRSTIHGQNYLSEDDVIILWQKQADGNYKITLMSCSPVSSAAEAKPENRPGVTFDSLLATSSRQTSYRLNRP